MTRHNFLLSLAVLLLAAGCTGAGKQQGGSYIFPDAPGDQTSGEPVLSEDPSAEEPSADEPSSGDPAPEGLCEFSQAIADQGWKLQEYKTIPDGIDIFRSPDKLLGKPEIAYIAVADLSKVRFDVWCIKDVGTQGTSEAFKTPSKVYEDGKWPVIINAGFFFADGGKYYSASLAISNSELLSTNINYASQDWVTVWYPTRGALLEDASGSIQTCWTYFISANSHYMYQNPADNSWDKDPLKTPSASFPEKASKVKAVTGIGGGPVLLKDGEIRNTYVQELFNGPSGILCEEEHPRTAIGVSPDDKYMVLFVCEGRQMTSGVQGLTHADLAQVMLDLGCGDALNLDGGGSTCMLIDGQETIKPSDGHQRAVASTVMLSAIDD
ncbi:MAG: phosphodiester glycosidase family protein [Bacteroidales bacterium]|nr:phosphodiester glycosidase family protein [Bacteroidales bacterium]